MISPTDPWVDGQAPLWPPSSLSHAEASRSGQPEPHAVPETFGLNGFAKLISYYLLLETTEGQGRGTLDCAPYDSDKDLPRVQKSQSCLENSSSKPNHCQLLHSQVCWQLTSSFINGPSHAPGSLPSQDRCMGPTGLMHTASQLPAALLWYSSDPHTTRNRAQDIHMAEMLGVTQFITITQHTGVMHTLAHSHTVQHEHTCLVHT